MKYLSDKNENPSLYPEDSWSESRKQLYIITLEFGGDRRVPVLAGKPVWPISESCKASLANQQEIGSFQKDKVGLIGKGVSERLVVSTARTPHTHTLYTHTRGKKVSIHKPGFTPFRNMHIYFVPILPLIFLVI